MSLSKVLGYFSVTECAKRAKVSPQAIRKAIKEERIDALKLGKQWAIRICVLENYIMDRRRR